MIYSGNKFMFDILDMYELDYTDEEKEDIVEILYKYFLQGIVKGKIEMYLGGVEIEVYIQDYMEELVEKVVNDISLDNEEVKLISRQLKDKQILNRWVTNKKCSM